MREKYRDGRRDVGELLVVVGLHLADLRHLLGGEDSECGAAEGSHIACKGGREEKRSWGGVQGTGSSLRRGIPFLPAQKKRNRRLAQESVLIGSEAFRDRL